ncbi:MAG: hypothetical protein U1U88_000855 [Lawsonella clevelandensis]
MPPPPPSLTNGEERSRVTGGSLPGCAISPCPAAAPEYLAFRLADSNDVTLTKFTTALRLVGPTGQKVTFPRVPQEGQLILHGRDALQIPVDFTIGDWGAYYSTGQLFFNGHLAGRPFAVVTGTAGDRERSSSTPHIGPK